MDHAGSRQAGRSAVTADGTPSEHPTSRSTSQTASRPPLGPWLAHLRRSRGMTQAVVANAIGRSESVLSRWESAERDMTPADLVVLTQALGVDAAEVLLACSVAPRERARASSHWPVRERRSFGTRVRRARKASGLRPIDIASIAGVNPYRLWKIESGSDPALAELQGLVMALGRQILESQGGTSTTTHSG